MTVRLLTLRTWRTPEGLHLFAVDVQRERDLTWYTLTAIFAYELVRAFEHFDGAAAHCHLVVDDYVFNRELPAHVRPP